MSRFPILASSILRQSVVFAVAVAASSLVGAVSTAILARGLSTKAFGTYSFAISFLLFVAMFFEFGLFLPAARQLATAPSRRRRQIVAGALLTFVPVGIGFSVTVFVLSFVVDAAFRVEAGGVLRAVAPLAFAYPFLLVAMMLAQGLGRLHVYSLGSLLLQGSFLLALLVAAAVGAQTVEGAVLFRAAAVALASAAMALWLTPRFRGARAVLPSLLQGARRFGLHVYAGRILGVGTYNMDALMLGALTDARTVGFYSLAVAITAASGLPVQGMGSALFARMATQRYIDRRWPLIAWGAGLLFALVTVSVSGPLVRLAFSQRYEAAVALVLPLALAQAVRGVTGVYNTYLSAQGLGRQLRNAGLVLTGSNLLLNFALIPPFGAAGAAWASLIALAANYVAHVVAYRRAASGEARIALPAGAEAVQ